MHSELGKEKHPADSAALREKEAMTERYDIFVSYRRKGGSEKAQLVKSEMQLRGIPDERIFLDTHSLHEGDFVSKIKTAVEESKNVVLIVSEGCFDEVRETDFWYMEIKEALQKALADQNYKIKFMTDKGLEECVRITLGRKEQTQVVVDTILRVIEH